MKIFILRWFCYYCNKECNKPLDDDSFLLGDLRCHRCGTPPPQGGFYSDASIHIHLLEERDESK